ncbi:MAG: substrate-binding periplasmic protein [Rhizobacter sp.]
MKNLKKIALSALLLAFGVGLRAAEPDAPTYLSVCLDDENAPFSAEARPERGIDVEVAQALGTQLGRPLKLVWVTVPNRGGIGRALQQTLVAKKCDAYVGIPQDPDLAKDMAERKLVTSSPYLTLGYVLVAAPGKPVPTAASLRGARRVGAVTATPADLFLFRKQFARAPYPGSAALIEALKAGEIDLALVWSSALAGDAGKSVVAATEAVDDADLYTGMTVATRSADTALTKDLATAIGALRSDGRIDTIMQRYGLPRIARP